MQVAYVFNDIPGLGYRVKPLVSERNKAVAKQVASAWINMINNLNPNGPGLQTEWPIYDARLGGGIGLNLVFKKDETVVEFDDFRAEALQWFSDHFLDVWGT